MSSSNGEVNKAREIICLYKDTVRHGSLKFVGPYSSVRDQAQQELKIAERVASVFLVI